MIIFGLFFYPAGIIVSGLAETLAALRRVSPRMRRLGEGAIPISGALYPWRWVRSEEESFKRLQVHTYLLGEVT